MFKQLPGKWVSFENLPFETTEQELQDLIVARTGVTIDLARISIAYFAKQKTARALISINGEHMAEFLTWALQDDRLHGAIVRATVRAKKSSL